MPPYSSFCKASHKKKGDCNPSPLIHLHVYFRRNGGSFSAIARTVQSAMVPGNRVILVVSDYNSLKHARKVIADVFKAYAGDFFSNAVCRENNIDLPNGASIKFFLPDPCRFCGAGADRVIVDCLDFNDGESTQRKNSELYMDALMPALISSSNPRLDVYMRHDPKDDAFCASEEYIRRSLERRIDFGEGVAKGTVSFDIDVI